ncbi:MULTISPECIES: LURP-one-related/scramblase family protein [unclassified Luteococcus]|uniref:LURP-one-related/scramblase family protein n=1 Tax=unclassified Luteococcus TaxID=2639923 RepID=UPI00313BBC74
MRGQNSTPTDTSPCHHEDMTLLEHDVLIIDQVTGFFTNDFAIHDAQGIPVGIITTGGSALSRSFLGSRQLTVVESDGRPLLTVDDVPNLGRDTFALLGPDGQRFAEVVKQFTLFSKHLTVQLADEKLELRGSFWEREFTVAGSQGQAAQVSRSWPGIGAALLGRERYALGFAGELPHHLRAATVGAVLALDLIRAKESSAASAGSSS